MVDSVLPLVGRRGQDWRGREGRWCECTVDPGGPVPTDLDALLTALYVEVDDFLEPRVGAGRPPRISDAELITLAVAQVFLEVPTTVSFWRSRDGAWRTCFPTGQSSLVTTSESGRPRRRSRASSTIWQFVSPSFCDGLRLLDSTPVPCGQSRDTTRRSEFAGRAGYGYCRSHSRYFWGFRLYLLCASDGMPIGFELAAAN